jgi:hypothetical protein
VFAGTNLEKFENNFLKILNSGDFYFCSEMKLFRMKALTKLELSSIDNCVIDIFDAPNLIEAHGEFSASICKGNKILF